VSSPTVRCPPTPSSTPTTITAALARPEVSSPLENPRTLVRRARNWARWAASMEVSRRAAVRWRTPYARITPAPTTLSPIAPSITPTRSRTRPYAPASRRCTSRTTSTSGTNATYTTSVSAHEYQAITTVAITNCPQATNSITPPHWRNWLIWSMSLVTRDTSAPRRSDCWCSIDRSWMCRKVRVRSPASAVSLTRNSRTFIRYPQVTVTVSTASVTATTVATPPS